MCRNIRCDIFFLRLRVGSKQGFGANQTRMWHLTDEEVCEAKGAEPMKLQLINDTMLQRLSTISSDMTDNS